MPGARDWSLRHASTVSIIDSYGRPGEGMLPRSATEAPWSVGFVQVGFRIATMKQIEEPLLFRLGDALCDSPTSRVRRDGGEVAR